MVLPTSKFFTIFVCGANMVSLSVTGPVTAPLINWTFFNFGIEPLPFASSAGVIVMLTVTLSPFFA